MFGANRLFHVLLITAFVLSGISPACAFVSGKHYMEICKADGTIERIEVPAEMALDSRQSEPSPKTAKTSDCAFCFTQSVQVGMTFDGPALPVVFAARYLSVGAGSVVPKTQKLYSFGPRGPPAFFS